LTTEVDHPDPGHATTEASLTNEPMPTNGQLSTEAPQTTADDYEIPSEVTDPPEPSIPQTLQPMTTEPPQPTWGQPTTDFVFVNMTTEVVHPFLL
jgi:hypothetical protein